MFKHTFQVLWVIIYQQHPAARPSTSECVYTHDCLKCWIYHRLVIWHSYRNDGLFINHLWPFTTWDFTGFHGIPWSMEPPDCHGQNVTIGTWAFAAMVAKDNTVCSWLVVGPPLWKIWVRQLGWWSQPNISGKIKLMATKPPTSQCSLFDHPCSPDRLVRKAVRGLSALVMPGMSTVIFQHYADSWQLRMYHSQGSQWTFSYIFDMESQHINFEKKLKGYVFSKSTWNKEHINWLSSRNLPIA